MSKIIQFPTERRVEEGADNADNPFLNTPLFAMLQKYASDRKPVTDEHDKIAKAGAGKRDPNPLTARSFALVLNSVRLGVTLREVLTDLSNDVLAGRPHSLTKFGMELVHYADTLGMPGSRAIDKCHWIYVDLSYDSKAEAIFKKAKIPNWRTEIARDCAEIKPGHRSEYYNSFEAMFILPMAANAKAGPAKPKLPNGVTSLLAAKKALATKASVKK